VKKSWSKIGGIVAVIILIILIVVANNADKKTATSKPNTTKTTIKSTAAYPIHEACNILTSTIAKQLVGDDATTTPQPDTQANSVNVSNCSYYSVTSKLSVGILARSPLATSAVETNQNQFGSGKPVGVQLVSGFGTSGYWSSTYGQLNILQHNTWYILTFGPLNPSQTTLAQTQQFANLVKDQL
jgi:hypothetical protein